MTIFTGPVFNWRTSGLDWDAPPYESSSPNLVALVEYMRVNFGGGSMGIHFDKPTTKGDVSEHSWGAALDWGSGQAQVDWIRSVGNPVGKALTRAEHFAAIDWVVAHSAELHIQSIVDIGRSWMAERPGDAPAGWKPYNSGYTGHAHLVTTFDGWGDDTPIADRLAPKPPTKPTPPPQEDPMLARGVAVRPKGYADQLWATSIANPEHHAKLGITEAPVEVALTAAEVARLETELGYKFTKLT